MNIRPVSGVGLEGYKTAGLRPVKPGATSVAGDTLEISGSPKLFSDALKAAAGTPVDRMDKISSIKQQIADGSYSVSSTAIAERMLLGVIRPEG